MDDYSTKLRDLLRQACPRLAFRHRLEFKRCFGAVASYVDGKIFASCGKFGVALRLPSQTLNELFREEDVLQLRYFPNGHVKKEYAVIPRRIIEDKGRFSKLVHTSVKYALPISSHELSPVMQERPANRRTLFMPQERGLPEACR